MHRQGISRPEELQEILAHCWSADTAFDPKAWSPDNPAAGQCAVTALLVQDCFGGTLLRSVATLPNGTTVTHYANRLPDGAIIDLTASQFPAGTSFADPVERKREYVASFPETYARYDRLRAAIIRFVDQLRQTRAPE